MLCYIGVDVGTASVRACITGVSGDILASHDHPISRRVDPANPMIITQSSTEIWYAVCEAIRYCVGESDAEYDGIAFSATCSLVTLSESSEGRYQPYAVDSGFTDVNNNIVLWMDHRAQEDAVEINKTLAQSGPLREYLDYLGGGFIPEMGLPKLKWLVDRIPPAELSLLRFMELHDYLSFMAITNGLVKTSPPAIHCSSDTTRLKMALDGSTKGWSRDILQAVGLEKLSEKNFQSFGRVEYDPFSQSSHCPIPYAGTCLGTVCPQSLSAFGISGGTVAVGHGVIDCYAGWISTAAGSTALLETLAMVAGTSTCYLLATLLESFIPGIWGPFEGLVSGLNFYEGGLSTTGALVEQLLATHPANAELVRLSATSQRSLFDQLNYLVESYTNDQGVDTCNELVKHMFFYGEYLGNRTPYNLPDMRGAFIGQSTDCSLKDLVYRYILILEYLCLQTRQIIETISSERATISKVVLSGSQAKNGIFTRMLATAIQVPVEMSPGDAKFDVVKGAAILAYLATAMSSILRSILNARAVAPSLTRSFHAGAAARTYAEEKVVIDGIFNALDTEDKTRMARMRNIGISAHIDSGKTTFSERVLFYTGRIKAIHEVRGRDNVGAKMDFMELEREKGITIQSAATYCSWDKDDSNYHFNLIDTPGHIDFTIEVERALRVLDGAVLVVCAVSGVQSQTVTVDRQMRRYNVPRITFVNKMDRMGADPFKAIAQVNQKLKIPAAAIQVPIGAESELAGVVNIIDRVALYNRGDQGEIIERGPVPADLVDLVEEKRALLIETLADVDEQMADIYLEGEEPTVEQIKDAIRRSTIARAFSPVLMGSALANRGIQQVLDAVCDYLPNPAETLNTGLDAANEEAPVNMVPSVKAPFVGLAFKLEEGKYGQLTYLRVYQGRLKKGGFITNVKTGKKIKVSRLVRMHSNDMEDVNEIGAGEICATFGVDCASGDTFTDGEVKYTMTSMYVPDAVISLSLTPTTKDTTNFSKALSRFQREDPTFRVKFDNESKETIISGMGELHLEIYIERMKREYNVECTTGKPQVAYREAILSSSDFDYVHKKQSGGSGQFGRVIGNMGACDGENKFETAVVGGKISEKFLAACAKGFEDACEKGPLIGHRVLGCHMVINDGQTHVVDSSELSFRTATVMAFKQAFTNAQPTILEPIMTVTVTAPNEFQGNIIGLLNKVQGVILDTENGPDEFVISSECSLNSMFGFATSLRAATQGKGEFSLEFKQYSPCPPQLQKELIAEYEKKKAEKKK
ncbi:hypothetical protein BABINDRAFT_7759 [Babjeviella inositovora NRRL Y-12698]|uniref:Elongation factor G, mitochondrial n=1 Tax=Babjeviella inositovora NRRL Y-12698 TaxID=984486 RepID=A0A1E3QRI8_9ASCO|nr:uncharacterized protein BABINDRAFT_7759 [Babjeviella inositovora NRRL Y-12698]ODQ80309.1 hypothetical protein BABINDRAFT_7759 [Babjeviella inositovora NRRL Y-12698]